MRKMMMLLLAAAMVAAFAGSAFAAIAGTAHDVPSMSVQGSCSSCHIPHKSLGKRLWPANQGANEASYGEVGALCYFCHGTGSTLTDAISMNNVFHANSHGRTKAEAPEGSANLDNTLPYVITADASMECTSCHNVHDDLLKPFLNADIDVLCARCHPDRQFVGGVEQTGAAAATGAWGAFFATTNPGTHPVGTDIIGEVSTHDITGDGTPEADSPIVITAIGLQVYDAGVTTHNLGSHAINAAAADLTTGMGCVTCHAPHGVQADGTAGTVPSEDLLAIAQGFNAGANNFLRHANGVGTAGNALCEACHRGDVPGFAGNAALFPNPGITTRYTHPVDDYTGTAMDTGVVAATLTALGWPVGAGTGNDPYLICESCHMPHALAAVTNNQTDAIVAAGSTN